LRCSPAVWAHCPRFDASKFDTSEYMLVVGPTYFFFSRTLIIFNNNPDFPDLRPRKLWRKEQWLPHNKNTLLHRDSKSKI